MREAMRDAIKKYEKVIEDVKADIEEAETFKTHLMEKYQGANDLDDVIKIQSMVLKISDYISQKRMSKVELERQLIEYENALKGE